VCRTSPPAINYNNETDRFRYAGHLWREANPERLTKVLQAMVDAQVAWGPNLDIYEASRDLQRAQTQPWFAELLHPALEEYFRPIPPTTASYFIGWGPPPTRLTGKKTHRLWMAALRQFRPPRRPHRHGDDAGSSINCTASA